ncbi:hypothetical protein [Embleya scabrispora]|uniref:hypothetical protein n=1 Tax=Embleya scabrispora TaxID=159449 RepID=UPI00039DF4C2|nr:hypothetical protein [Embleya scabrispora]MYS86605.1 hypothetical protein [Streptomyces sp. SID5474]
MTTPDGGAPFHDRYQRDYIVSPGPGCTPSFQESVRLARHGELEAVFSLLADSEGKDEDLDELAYKLFCVASDFGHEEAADLIDDLLEASSLRYDDDRFVQGNAHFELALAYLRGSDGLPADPGKAREHLGTARDCHWPWGVDDGETLLAAARAILSPPQRVVFDGIYGAD